MPATPCLQPPPALLRTFAVASATLLLLGGTPTCAEDQSSPTQPGPTQPGHSQPERPPSLQAGDPMAAVNSVAQDRSIWQQLLSDHASIRRTVIHRDVDGLGIVEAITESDDPTVAARIIDHAKAMQARMTAGAQVRVWDPVFTELFARHDKVALEVAVTPKGVRIVESSRDPETIALLRSHAMGVSDFVRHGHAAGRRETPRLPVGGPPPPSEVAIGGVPHRFLLEQPEPAQIALLAQAGVDRVLNFRGSAEFDDAGERAAATAAGIAYLNLPYQSASQLTDALLDAARAELREAGASGSALALHCRTGNRVGPGWAAYLALDKGVGVEQAIQSAKAVGMVDPLYESIARDHIRRQRAARVDADAAWRAAPSDLSPAQAAQRQRAVDARDAMFARLFARLMEAMAAPGPDGRPVGPAGAVAVCRQEAPRIARTVASETGVMIGRTSDRLRNPSNLAPAWAAALLADAPREERRALNVDGSFGVVLPISIAPPCLACHGAADSLEPQVREALASAYPQDRATGYAAGDLRGWFWIEVPPGAPPTQTVGER